MTKEQHLNDLSEIRSIMERSTRFLSLSGWAGIFAGIFALAGSLAAYIYLDGGNYYYSESYELLTQGRSISFRIFALLDAGIVLGMAVLFAFLFSYRKAKKNGQKFWTPVTRTMLFHMLVPLAAGGIFCLILIWQGDVNLIAPLTLIFYGVSILNAGKYTNKEIIWLAIAEIITGLAATVWQCYGLYFWALGFGLYHIIYGVTLYYKYDRKASVE